MMPIYISGTCNYSDVHISKGDLTSAANYRDITLMPIAAKVYNKLLLNMIIPTRKYLNT